MLRWEILEIIEQNDTVLQAMLHRPLGQTLAEADANHLSFAIGHQAHELIRAVLFDGYEPLTQAVVALPDGSIQKYWTFRLQIVT